MITQRIYCGVCQKKVDGLEDVRNEISGRNSRWHFFADDVCDNCVSKFGKLIEELGGELKKDGNSTIEIQTSESQ